MTRQAEQRAGGPGSTQAGTVDADDLARFERLGASWWDSGGPMRMLHEINPVRLRYLLDTIARHRVADDLGRPSSAGPLAGLTMLDIGCGGGVLAEPLCRLGGIVTGIDPAPGNIAAARDHADLSGLSIDYRASSAEELAAGGARFDVVLAMEVVEHVSHPGRFVGTVCSLVKPGGLLLASTLNRTAKSFLLAIVGAEYVLGWLPRGTHRWTQFVTPDEFAAMIRRSGLAPLPATGMVYDPLRGEWSAHADTDVNYFIAARKPVA